MSPAERERPAWANRLERIRQHAGAATLKDFYGELAVQEIDGFPSYSAARTYHFAPYRPPAVTYLQAILRAFPDVSPVWLFYGDGPLERIREGLKDLQENTQFAGEVFGSDQISFFALEEIERLADVCVDDDFRLTARALAAPFRVLEVDPDTLPAGALSHYIEATAELLRFTLGRRKED